MKKGCLFVVLLIVLFIMLLIFISNVMSSITEMNWEREELTFSDLKKYNYNICIKYKFASCDYIINISSNSIIDVNTYENKDLNTEKYYKGKFNEEYGILNEDGKIVISIADIEKKINKHINSYDLVKYNSNNNTIYFILDNYYTGTIVSYSLTTKEFNEIMKISQVNDTYGHLFYKLTNDKIYALNEKKELCEYDTINKVIKKIFIVPKCFDVNNNILAYSEDNDWKKIYIYDLNSNKIINSIKTKGNIQDFQMNKSNDFIIATETMHSFTNNVDQSTAMSLTPIPKNRIILYEISSNKHRIIQEADKNNLVYEACFMEQ